jgi:hypothetical protein
MGEDTYSGCLERELTSIRITQGGKQAQFLKHSVFWYVECQTNARVQKPSNSDLFYTIIRPLQIVIGGLYLTAWGPIWKDSTLCSPFCGNLKSCVFKLYIEGNARLCFCVLAFPKLWVSLTLIGELHRGSEKCNTLSGIIKILFQKGDWK